MVTKPYHHGNLRDSLLDAADALLAQDGAQALTLREVAKAAGVSHAAPYHHFASREQLLAAVAARAFAGLAAAMATADNDHTRGQGERLMDICEVYVEFARARPAQFRLMFGPLLAQKSHYPDLKQAAEGAFNVLVTAATAFDAPRGPELALTGWSLAHGLANLAIDEAFTDLPIAVPAPSVLARAMTARMLGLQGGVDQ
ncbi:MULTISPECIES: TetR/AcrR family transcriptional regulator [unclassified Duganella]|uniref:TetR/AcrR family transcriptional regulator n=1 Tax=unclassified Duganella TaxID=2636909 RepID=UPI000E34FE07|nr:MULTISPECIES: TetR/AcrR family transcriptional regulator [unclassified Duganella]RFP14610.1 TetR/AcrR family transcriptional regulator [Duganella sp. BJB475]RFP30958.1 TetR/AcrR family transcriptional regulator [Duganella sp. BJB476]